MDSARSDNMVVGLTGKALELATGQDTLEKMVAFPVVLIVLFTVLFFWQENSTKVEKRRFIEEIIYKGWSAYSLDLSLWCDNKLIFMEFI